MHVDDLCLSFASLLYVAVLHLKCSPLREHVTESRGKNERESVAECRVLKFPTCQSQVSV